MTKRVQRDILASPHSIATGIGLTLGAFFFISSTLAGERNIPREERAPLVAARGSDTEALSTFKRDFQAKVTYCKTCHGLSGEGFRGYSVMPRLAGQRRDYFENQIRAFVERRRKNNFMFNVARVLSPAMVTALAAHFSDLNAEPVRGAPSDLVAAGRKLYEQGVPGSDVQPCASCHGPDAQGDGAVPRLASQLASYTLKTLTNWSEERGQDAANPDVSAVMEPIAHGLSQAQMSALAAYLSDLGTPPLSSTHEARGGIGPSETISSVQQPRN